MLNGAAEPTGRPSWIYLTGNSMQNHSRELSGPEQVAQTYASVIAGASGIKYFLGDPAGREHWLAMKRTNAELLALESVLFSRDPAPTVECSAADIVWTARRVGSQVYLLAVNVEDRAVTGKFRLMSDVGGRNAVVLFEDRVLGMDSDVLADEFAPFARHVYRLGKQ
jgi:hypothetical protein